MKLRALELLLLSLCFALLNVVVPESLCAAPRFPIGVPAATDPFSSFATPEAHWATEKQINLFYAGFRLSEDLKFELVTDSPVTAVELSLLSHRGNIWTLSTDRIVGQAQEWIRRPLWVRILDPSGQEIFRTSLRLTGMLDQMFADTSRQLGITWVGGDPEFRLWAPTATKVELLLYDKSDSPTPWRVIDLKDESSGFWFLRGEARWDRRYYTYRVTRFSPRSSKIDVVESVDPMSLSLSVDGQRSQIVDLGDSRLMPPGWNTLSKPMLRRLTDAVIYETHLRDFTAADPNIPEKERGTYLGIVDPRGTGFEHLRSLAQAGVTHIHLMPILEFAGVPEKIEDRKSAYIPSSEPPDSEYPQDAISRIRNEDSYNWGYNPVLYTVPEGSYSTDPDGPSRILEMRTMVSRMNQAGLRVVLDVVYNHTLSAFEDDFSVFDRIVPYYYHRYNERGYLMSSSCCADVATENRMVEKLIIDSLVLLAKEYKVDGFRFDLMNLHPTAQAPRLRAALDSLTTLNSGLEGSKILLYGEAWPFGSLEELNPGAAFTQVRSYGTGVGVFNDRIRDALRGGTTDPKEKSDQGFATGLFWDFNSEPANRSTPGNADAQRDKLLHLGDVIKIGMAGNLRDIVIRDHLNNSVRAADLYFRSAPTGYAAEPVETINYVSSHDGYTLWDAVQAKVPFHTRNRWPGNASHEERIRTQKLMLATILLSQGIPFIEGGSELLRSKSGDADSYDSGDFFNRIDWSLNSNNWGVGLPVGWKNLADWSFWRPRLQDQDLKIGRSEIESTRDYFLALLRLRRANPLLRLSSANEISRLVSFPMNDRSWSDSPGLVVMVIEDTNPPIDPKRKSVVVLINAATQPQTFQSSRLAGKQWHFPVEFGPAQDPYLGGVTFDTARGVLDVPARTVVVLEESR